MKTSFNYLRTTALIALLSVAGITTVNAQSKKQTDSLKSVLAAIAKKDQTVAKHLKTFDTLDFTIFSGMQWARFHESHGKDIKVVWPDGHITIGLAKHLEEMKALFVYAPDTRIKQHPISFGSGNRTAVTG